MKATNSLYRNNLTLFIFCYRNSNYINTYRISAHSISAYLSSLFKQLSITNSNMPYLWSTNTDTNTNSDTSTPVKRSQVSVSLSTLTRLFQRCRCYRVHYVWGDNILILIPLTTYSCLPVIVAFHTQRMVAIWQHNFVVHLQTNRTFFFSLYINFR